MKQRILLLVVLLSFLFVDTRAQSWIVKDSILVFPQGFSSWLKRNNGGIDSANPGPGNSMGGIGVIGTNQGVVVYDFNKDGKKDLTFQIFPSNNATREYLMGIFLQQSNGKFLLDTNFVIKGKGDMGYGSYGDFNGDGLIDYQYITSNYHGADSNRKYNPEMVDDHWPERVFINNGKTFDTLSLDLNNIKVSSTIVLDVDEDGIDEIIAMGATGDKPITFYKYNNLQKRFDKIKSEISVEWNKKFNPQITGNPNMNIPSEISKNKISFISYDSAVNGKYGPFSYNNFNRTEIDLKNITFKTNYWERPTWTISSEKSKEDAVDNYKFNIHPIPTIYKLDIDDDGTDEYVTGGFYMNDNSVTKQRFAYGWKVYSQAGFDVTTKFFADSGIDRNVDLISHGLDIDKNFSGIEIIPGTWGADGTPTTIGTVGYYYVKNKSKLERKFMTNLIKEDGTILQTSYLKTRQITLFPNYTSSQNAILTYDFQDIKRSAIIYQYDCKQPTISAAKNTICGSDSVSVKITNRDPSVKYTWYVNNDSVSKSSDSLFIKKEGYVKLKLTDTLGCSKISDSIYLKSYPLPTTPTISRDTANNLLSSAALRNTWYKDGTAIADTTQKIKPSGAGSFTVKTSENGCASVASNAYYYLVTDVINLSANEFIKLAPNPFQGQLNLDFSIKGYQKLNIDVFELTTGVKMASQQNILPGSVLNFGNLAPGTYIIKVSSNDQKLSHQFKMIKL